MPTKSTRSRGAMMTRTPLFFAASSCARLGRPYDLAARLLVRLKLDKAFFLGFLEEVGEGTETIVRLVEAGIAALERLLDHRAPDLFFGTALRGESLERAEHLVERLLLLVLACAGGSRLLTLFRGA